MGGHAFTAAALQQLLLTQDVAPDNSAECLSELPDSVGVDERVDHGIGVREDNGQVLDKGGGWITPRAEEGEAVDDMQGQPTDGKQTDNDSQRFGRVNFLL